MMKPLRKLLLLVIVGSLATSCQRGMYYTSSDMSKVRKQVRTPRPVAPVEDRYARFK
jgi:hypothetical protein